MSVCTMTSCQFAFIKNTITDASMLLSYSFITCDTVLNADSLTQEATVIVWKKQRPGMQLH